MPRKTIESGTSNSARKRQSRGSKKKPSRIGKRTTAKARNGKSKRSSGRRDSGRTAQETKSYEGRRQLVTDAPRVDANDASQELQEHAINAPRDEANSSPPAGVS